MLWCCPLPEGQVEDGNRAGRFGGMVSVSEELQMPMRARKVGSLLRSMKLSKVSSHCYCVIYGAFPNWLIWIFLCYVPLDSIYLYLLLELDYSCI